MQNLKSISDSLSKIVEYAGVLAQRARSEVQIELKEDGSIVTQADRQVENWLSAQLVKLLPGTEMWGEESGFKNPGPKGLWVVDPIDGTANYAFGSPLWGVSVAYYHEERIQLAEICLPDLSESYTAILGQGAHLNGQPLPSIPEGPIQKHELIGYPDSLLKDYPQQKWPGRMRQLGAEVVHGTFMASQRHRAHMTVKVKFYDIAGCVCIMRELGAEILYANGKPFQEKELVRDTRLQEPLLFFPKGAYSSL